MVTTFGYVDQAALDSAVRRVERDFSSEVVHIRYSVENNHYGDPSISFRILVRDEAAPVKRLVELWRTITVALRNDARTYENGLQAYFTFRSISEQQELGDPDWD
jgi:hypothetical protein